MSVVTIDGHILFPHRANYGRAPVLGRAWQSEVADAELGNESRFGLRGSPRRSVSWGVTAADLQEQSQLLDRITAAQKTGLACTPIWGRASSIASPGNPAELYIDETDWPWAEGDKVFLLNDDGEFDVAEVAIVSVGNPTTLTLDAETAHPHRFDTWAWPMLFGKFSCDTFNPLTASNGEAQLTVSELESAYLAQVGNSVAPIDGIGGWIIGNTFIVQ